MKDAFYDVLKSDLFEQRVRNIVKDVVCKTVPSIVKEVVLGEEGRQHIKEIVWEVIAEHDEKVIEPLFAEVFERLDRVEKRLGHSTPPNRIVH